MLQSAHAKMAAAGKKRCTSSNLSKRAVENKRLSATINLWVCEILWEHRHSLSAMSVVQNNVKGWASNCWDVTLGKHCGRLPGSLMRSSFCLQKHQKYVFWWQPDAKWFSENACNVDIRGCGELRLTRTFNALISACDHWETATGESFTTEVQRHTIDYCISTYIYCILLYYTVMCAKDSGVWGTLTRNTSQNRAC